MSKPNQIRSFRQLAGMSQADVAKKVKMSPAVLSYIENGAVLPTMENIEALSALFGCSPSDLFDLDQFKFDAEPRKGEAFQGKRAADEVFRVHLKTAEKEILLSAIKVLGYQNGTEWFREKMRETVNRYRLLTALNPESDDSIADV